MKFNEAYWSQRYRNQETGWDLGAISPPLKYWIDQLENKELSILIPGAGNAYEAEYLFHNGFKNVFVCDISEIPLKELKKRVPEFPKENLIHCDFFDLKMEFDVILEQTFFCALDPSQRNEYVKKMFQLLKSGGKLMGVLFGVVFEKSGPPFGGSIHEYETLFAGHFSQVQIHPCKISIKPRTGTELMFICTK